MSTVNEQQLSTVQEATAEMSSSGAKHLLVLPYRANLSICERFIFLTANIVLRKCCLPYEIYSTITKGCIPYQENKFGPSEAIWLANLSAYQQWYRCFYSYNTEDQYSRYFHNNYRDRVNGWDQGWDCSVKSENGAYQCHKENSSFSLSWDLSYYCFEYVQEVGRFLPFCIGEVSAKLFIRNFLSAAYVYFLILATILMPLAVFLQVMLSILIPLKLVVLIQTMLTVIIAIFINDITFLTVEMYLNLIIFPPTILVIVTFLLYLIVPELRKNVQDKCFTCYLGSFTMGLILFLYYAFADASSIELGLAEKFLMISGMSWLNAISIHLWRSVRTMRRLPGRDFYFYSFYAWGCPTLCILAHIIHCRLGFDRCIPGHKYIFAYTSNWFDPFFLYFVYPANIGLMINSCLLVHVMMIIWNKKRQWNKQSKQRNWDVQKHVNQQKRRFWKYLKLYSIAWLDWISMILLSYMRSSSPYFLLVLCIFFFSFTFCSGILIFCNFVYCNKKTMSILKSKFSRQHRSVVVVQNENAQIRDDETNT